MPSDTAQLVVLVCPACGTRYSVGAAALGAKGRTVRCKQCRQSWFQAPEEPAGDAPDSGGEWDGPPAEAAAEDRTEAEIAAPAPAPPAVVIEPEAVPRYMARPAAGAAGPELAPAPQGLAARLLPAALTARPAFAAGLACVVLLGLLGGEVVAGRTRMLALWPGAARIYDALGLLPAPPGAGLQLRGVDTSTVQRDGTAMLVVSGTLANISDRQRFLPVLEASLRDQTGGIVKTWPVALDRRSLPAGGAFHFETATPAGASAGGSIEIAFRAPGG